MEFFLMSATLHKCSRMKHELTINIYETFMGIHGHLCDAVGKEDKAWQI